MRQLSKMAFSLMILIVTMFNGCGGGSSSGDSDDGGSFSTSVASLKLPGNIDVIKAADETSTSTKVLSKVSSATLVSKYAAPSGSDYETDTAQFWVRDDSTEALNVVNMIMGFIRDTSYADFMNKGAYIALIEEDEDNEGSQDAAKGQTSSDESEQLMEFVVNVTRENNTSAMVIDGWLDENEGREEDQNISFKITVTEEVSAEYPAGAFIMYIKGVQSDGTVSMRNILEIGKSGDATLPVSVKYKEAGGDAFKTFTAEANLLATTDFTSGKAYTQSNCYDESINQEGSCEYKIAYNSAYARTDITSFNGVADANDTGIILDKNNYSYKIFNYGLYETTTGNKPKLNVGKHIKITVDGETYNGHVGYWGIWTWKSGLDFSSAIVEDDDGVNYTVFTAPGRLEQSVKLSITLSELDGVTMNMWDGNSEKVIEWDKNDEKFYQVGTQTWSQNGPPVVTALESKVELTANNTNEWDGAWCNDLGARFEIGRLFRASGVVQSALTNSSKLQYFKRNRILPGDLDTDLTLLAYSDIKYKGTVTKESIGGTSIVESVDFGTVDWENDSADDVFKSDYSFAKDTMTLNAGSSVDANKSIVFASDIKNSDLNGVNYNWGLHVEPLLDATTLATVVGEIGPINMENWWQIRNKVNSFYSWHTGLDEWNKLEVLKKTDGSFVSFDQPWEISYTHSTANDRDGLSINDGKKFRLHYDGNNLNMPWGYDAVKKTWKPVLALKDDVELTYLDKTYVIKALEGEKLLNKVTAAEVVAAGGTVPDISSISLGATNLDLSDVDGITFAEKPTGDLTVKVIKGVIQ